MIISVNNDGYVLCKSKFYTARDVLSDRVFDFTLGVNKLVGGIDSGNWAVSYLLSMYKYKSKDFTLSKDPAITVNNDRISLDEFSKCSCYMDTIHPMFSKKTSVDKLVAKGLKKSKADTTSEKIRELFCIDQERFTRPLSQVGNEIFQVMAAIGYANGKDVFCFPWLSDERYRYYQVRIDAVTEILASLDKVVILPLERENDT